MSGIVDIYHENLALIVEFSIGLAGFSAIVTAFLQKSSSLSPVDRFRTLNLLLLALTPAFLSFLCIGLLILSGDIILASRVTSIVFAVSVFFTLYSVFRSRRKLPAEHQRALNNKIILVMFLVSGIVLVSQVASALIDSRYAYPILYFGLVVMLLQAVVQFVRILVGARVHGDT